MKFRIVYGGPALDDNTMDVRDLAPALLAFSEVLEQANRTLNGKDHAISVRVNASFKAGSFGIDLELGSLLQKLVDMFSDKEATAAANLLAILGFIGGVGGGLVALIKWVKNRKITRVEVLSPEECRVFVEKDFLDADRKVIDLFQDLLLRQALQKAIMEPLRKEGIDSFAITIDEGHTFTTIITKEEGLCFEVPPLDDEQEELPDVVSEQSLTLVSLSFRDENKWRFFDGQTTFYASITDDFFLHQVDKGEVSFTNGDIMRVILRTRQSRSSGTLKAEYEVEKVIRLDSVARQIRLPFVRS